MELACSVSHVLATDVCMALDWKTSVREWLIGLGLPPSDVFDHLYGLDPRAGSSEPLAMSERWQPVPLRDNINGSEPMNPANINRSQLSHYPGTSVPLSACARDSRSVRALYHNNIQSQSACTHNYNNYVPLQYNLFCSASTSVPTSVAGPSDQYTKIFSAAMIILFAPIYPFTAFLPKDCQLLDVD
ncbi:hypothetical protein B0H13DRAFT_2684869 [Mycena leptocephala]|nr:hypothetical protein B0H13DRAFT_2684869 [Mycena leptocephala]